MLYHLPSVQYRRLLVALVIDQILFAMVVNNVKRRTYLIDELDVLCLGGTLSLD
jgi:hypothetical protein